MFDASQPNLGGSELEYTKARADTSAVLHEVCYTLFPRLVPEGAQVQGKVVGPVLPPQYGCPASQAESFESSGLRSWCDESDVPIVYVSFGSMMRGVREDSPVHGTIQPPSFFIHISPLSLPC